MRKRLRVTRDVTVEECPWLFDDVEADQYVFEAKGPTYGCISRNGKAVTWSPEGDYPFFELPLDALEYV